MFKEPHLEELIVKSFSDSISHEENVILKEWLHELPENLRHYRELENIWQLSHLAFLPDDIDVDEAQLKFMQIIDKKKFIDSGLFVWFQRVAAILIIPLISLSFYLIYSQFFQSKISNIAYQEITSPLNMNSKLNLPDGTIVWLNSGSKLKYPVKFESNERNVYLSGEAFFKVHADKVHPFIVSTNKLNVKATGTQFNVEAYSTDTITAVTLMEGKVNVNIGNSIREDLKPNQRMVLNSNSNTYTVLESDAQHWGLWKDGILAFRDQPLSDVFKRLGRTFNVDIQAKDPVIARQLYRATFEDESFEEILKLLQISAPIKYKRVVDSKKDNNIYNKEKIEVYSSK